MSDISYVKIRAVDIVVTSSGNNYQLSTTYQKSRAVNISVVNDSLFYRAIADWIYPGLVASWQDIRITFRLASQVDYKDFVEYLTSLVENVTISFGKNLTETVTPAETVTAIKWNQGAGGIGGGGIAAYAVAGNDYGQVI